MYLHTRDTFNNRFYWLVQEFLKRFRVYFGVLRGVRLLTDGLSWQRCKLVQREEQVGDKMPQK